MPISETYARIAEGYRISGEFCNLMGVFESLGVSRSNLADLPYYAEKFDREDGERAKMMEEHPKELAAGALAYLATHPRRMARAQQYYGRDFGTVCPLEDKD